MIQLSENWRLTADEVQFILQKKNIRKQSDGGAEEVWVNKYYYPTLQMALLAYMTKQTRAKGLNENVTPKTEESVRINLTEEMLDCSMVMALLCFKDKKIMMAVLDESDIGDTPKWKRWAEWLGYKG